jgi:hypothetical protein
MDEAVASSMRFKSVQEVERPRTITTVIFRIFVIFSVGLLI